MINNKLQKLHLQNEYEILCPFFQSQYSLYLLHSSKFTGKSYNSLVFFKGSTILGGKGKLSLTTQVLMSLNGHFQQLALAKGRALHLKIEFMISIFKSHLLLAMKIEEG